MSLSDARRGARFLGIDGGGTATRAVVVNADGVVCGRGTAGGANQEVVGFAAAVEAVRTAARAAMAEAGAESSVRAAWTGLAGVDTSADSEAFRPALAPLADDLRVTNDGELLLGALPNRSGLVLIAGTGSVTLGRNVVGQTARAGGWGHIFGDEGSGYALGIAALRAVARAADGRGEPTALTTEVLRVLKVAAPSALIGRVHGGWDKAEIARLASLVVAAAEESDGVALAILRHAAAELAEQARSVMRALALEAPLPLALGGGLLLEAPAYRALVLEALGAKNPPARRGERGSPRHNNLRGQGEAEHPAALLKGQPAFGPVELVRDAALVAARSLAAAVE